MVDIWRQIYVYIHPSIWCINGNVIVFFFLQWLKKKKQLGQNKDPLFLFLTELSIGLNMYGCFFMNACEDILIKGLLWNYNIFSALAMWVPWSLTKPLIKLQWYMNMYAYLDNVSMLD